MHEFFANKWPDLVEQYDTLGVPLPSVLWGIRLLVSGQLALK